MPPKPTKSANGLGKIHESLAAIFDQAQLTLANHRKNCVALHKLHQQAATVTQDAKNGTVTKLVGEKAFGDAFVDMVNRVLVVKKGPAAADRVVRFIGLYVKFMNEKVLVAKAKVYEDPSSSVSARLESDTDEDTFASRFVTRLLKWLLRGFLAKSKTTRYRSVSIVADMIAHIGEVDEDMYNLLHEGLLDRICDKESLIRAHAVIALSKLVGSEDPDEADPGERTILEVLLDIVSYDPAPEVRRAALLNVPLLPATLDTILSRTRDTDILIRKLVYTHVLQAKLGHPRHLTIAQREQVIKDGLGDREPSVRLAAGKLVASWFDLVLPEPDVEDETWEGDDAGIMKGFVKFLALFDVVGPGEVVAVDAMLSIFVTRPNVTEGFVFSDGYWKELTPESAVLARVYLEHCISMQSEARLEGASLPVVTAFAFHLQEEYNSLVGILQEAENAAFLVAGEDVAEEEAAQREEELAKKEVVLAQLLRIALNLDYMDEIGRRKLFSVVRDMVAHPELPPGLINPCLDVLKAITTTERDLIRLIVEIIVDLREQESDAPDDRSVLNDESHADISRTTISRDKSMQRTKTRDLMTPEERMEADVTDLRCLSLCIGVLERVDGTFEDNSTLEGILADLIIPSVKRKELSLREKGLVSLGLCCLIAKNMALSSFQLFLNQVHSAPEELKARVLQVIFDLLIMYEQEFFGRSEEISQKIVDFILQTLEVEESPDLQALICVGLSKLLLSGMITDLRVLTGLILTYVSPTTSDNQELRQCLSYFFPVYCYSSAVNQSRMQSIFITVFDLFIKLHESLEEDQEMITPHQFGLLMVDWTNPQKRARVDGANDGVDTHVELATDILAALYDSERSGEDQKVLCQLLSQLHIMPGLDFRSIHKLNLLLEHHEEQCPFADEAVSKIFNKFKSRFTKIFAKELKRIVPGKYLDDEFMELYNFIGVDPPEPSDDPAPSSTAPSRSQSLVQSGEAEVEGPSPSGSEGGSSSPTPWPSVEDVKGERSARRNTKKIPPIEEDADQVSDTTATPVPQVSTPKKKGVKRGHAASSVHSQAARKRSRINDPHKPCLKKVPKSESDDEESTPMPEADADLEEDALESDPGED